MAHSSLDVVTVRANDRVKVHFEVVLDCHAEGRRLGRPGAIELGAMRQRSKEEAMRFPTALVLATLAAALVTASAQTDFPMAKAESIGMSSKRLERINAFIKGYIDRNEIAGAVTLVARKGKIVHFEA